MEREKKMGEREWKERDVWEREREMGEKDEREEREGEGLLTLNFFLKMKNFFVCA